jgi:phosphoglycerol transferase MdoB-like AlkP superfamily enzyme
MKLSTNKTLEDVFFMLGVACLSLVTFAILRTFLIIRNADLLEGIPAADIIHAYLIGTRFDLIVVSYILIPLCIGLLLPDGLGKRKIAVLWIMLAFALSLFIGIVELDFYHEFHNRLNSIAYQYLKEDPATVSNMLWNGFPVIRYLLLWIMMLAIYAYAVKWISTLTTVEPVKSTSFLKRGLIMFLLLLLLIVGARGGTVRSGPPLRWGDAFHSSHLFANHLALNGTYTFLKALINVSNEVKGKIWLESLPKQEALETTRQMILTDRDTLLKPETNKILRHHQPKKTIISQHIKNVVVILMESFIAKYVGAFGHDYNITPEFDKLTRQGLLFENFFSNGTHTHQGMFATFSCFPNLPGFEYLMSQPQGRNAFSGLPALLKREKFNDLYVYNGDFAWDNQGGFFRNQGLSHFIGRSDYINPKFQDRTWGVSDEDMFSRAVEELDKLDPEQPFFAMLQTLSNHTPYALPKQLPFEPLTDFGGYSEHLTAMKYSDWALGEFFNAIKDKPFYQETLFVILGDHGFGVSPQISDIDLLRFHVPLLLIAPGMTREFGNRNTTVATQVDVVPTIVGLLGKPFTHQCWGRNILSLDKSDKGFGVIKPSGSDQTVALLRGDTILVKQPNVPAQLGRYALKPGPVYSVMNDDELKKRMNKELLSYIETALFALYDNQAGLE